MVKKAGLRYPVWEQASHTLFTLRHILHHIIRVKTFHSKFLVNALTQFDFSIFLRFSAWFALSAWIMALWRYTLESVGNQYIRSPSSVILKVISEKLGFPKTCFFRSTIVDWKFQIRMWVNGKWDIHQGIPIISYPTKCHFNEEQNGDVRQAVSQCSCSEYWYSFKP